MGRLTRTLLGAAAGATVALALAAPAAAHVTVNPKQADPGSYARLAFRVPNEQDKATTTRVQVFLPAGLASVSVAPVPGWTVAVHKKKLATPLKTDDGTVTEGASDILWTASKTGAIQPGQFQEFPVSVGPLPKSGALTFKALQTYSDGTVVRWIQQASGSTEPDHPAPVLTITASAVPPAGSAPAKATGSTGASAGTALAVAIAGAVLGLLGLILGGLAFLRGRRAD